jgi:hypothetical protein
VYALGTGHSEPTTICGLESTASSSFFTRRAARDATRAVKLWSVVMLFFGAVGVGAGVLEAAGSYLWTRLVSRQRLSRRSAPGLR